MRLVVKVSSLKGGHSNDTDIAKDYLFTNEGVQTFEMNDLKQNIRMEQGVHFQQSYNGRTCKR